MNGKTYISSSIYLAKNKFKIIVIVKRTLINSFRSASYLPAFYTFCLKTNTFLDICLFFASELIFLDSLCADMISIYVYLRKNIGLILIWLLTFDDSINSSGFRCKAIHSSWRKKISLPISEVKWYWKLTRRFLEAVKI